MWGYVAGSIHDTRYRWMIEKLVEARKAQNISQEELAGRLGKPQQYVSRFEVRERRLDVVEFLDVAAALGVDGLAIAAGAMNAEGCRRPDGSTKP
jgi:transcriptional regulator with XRE-family HTH domain